MTTTDRIPCECCGTTDAPVYRIFTLRWCKGCQRRIVAPIPPQRIESVRLAQRSREAHVVFALRD